MGKKSNVITNIVIILFIIIGFAGMALTISQYSSIIDKDTAAKQYLQEDSIYKHSLETDLCIAINLGRNSKNTEDTSQIDEYLKKVDSYLEQSKNVMAEYEKIEKTKEEENVFSNVKTAMGQYTSTIQNEILPQIEAKHYESANSLYFDKFVVSRNKLDDYVSELLALTQSSIDKNYKSVVTKTRLLQVFFTLFGVILLVIVNLIEKGREKMAKNLAEETAKTQDALSSLNTAVFNDTLTNTNNRFSFMVDYGSGKTSIEKDEIYYFMMLDIKNFSDINISNGNDTGDQVLKQTVSRIKAASPDIPLFRTGSDEFVLVIKEKSESGSFERAKVIADKIYDSLTKPYNINNISLQVKYSAAMVKKNGPLAVDSSVLGEMKQLMLEGERNPSGKWSYSST
ncbi:MAG: GGDEF domain-containing protein [Ruminococcus sp.]|nr:GGDEF domain-containing protein [Ruminococcus sp.]